MLRQLRREFRQTGQEAGVAYQLRRRRVIGVPALTGRRDHYRRTKAAKRADEQLARRRVVHDRRVGQIEVLARGQTHDLCRAARLGGPHLRSTARSFLTLRQIENGGSISAPRLLDQRAAAGQLDIVPMRRHGQYIDRRGDHARNIESRTVRLSDLPLFVSQRGDGIETSRAHRRQHAEYDAGKRAGDERGCDGRCGSRCGNGRPDATHGDRHTDSKRQYLTDSLTHPATPFCGPGLVAARDASGRTPARARWDYVTE